MTEYQDYKYVMQDTGNLYLGAKYTYDELLDNEDVPFKLKTVIHRNIAPEIDTETSLESHFYYMTDQGFVYETCKQLKIKVKYSVPVEKKSLFGKRKISYQTKVLKLEKFVAISPAEKEEMGIMIQEIGMSKMALMVFSA